VRYFLLAIALIPAAALAQTEYVTGKATPLEVYQKVVAAAAFLAEKGEAGLAEFENPNGRFVWKDSYVYVTRCEEQYCLPTPKSRELGLNFSEAKCYLTGKLVILSLCDEAQHTPNGAWVEYWWPKPGVEKPQRKVSYMRQVPNTPFQVVADIFNDTASLAELNTISNAPAK
jgi:hypothetical protein